MLKTQQPKPARFGRMKPIERVRMHERIAELKHDVYTSRMLLKDMSDRLRRAQGELEWARTIAGDLSLLFPKATAIKVSGEPREMVLAAARGRFDPRSIVERSGLQEPPKFEKVPLHVLLPRIEPAAMQRAVHADVQFSGQHVRLGITAESLATIRQENLEDYFMQRAAWPLVQAVIKGLRHEGLVR